MTKKILVAFVAALTIVGCTKSNFSEITEGSNNVLKTNTYCGEADVHALLAGQYTNAGTVTVTNDQTNLYVQYNTIGGWWLNKIHLYVGDCATIPTSGGGNPQVGLFPTNITFTPNVTNYTVTIPLSTLGSCYCIAAHAEVVLKDGNGQVMQRETGWAQGGPFGGNSWAMKFSYCTQSCENETPCEINAGDYRTQTQGGWGAVPSGNNPGMYLTNNFTSAFPSGVTIGCGNKTLTFTNAGAITTFLPCGGTPLVLSSSATNPSSLNNVLAGQVLTLALTLGFDNAIDSFSTSNSPLGDLMIASGQFQGYTVSQILTLANNILGGCSNYYTTSQINAIVTAINENFDNGTVNNGLLVCNN